MLKFLSLTTTTTKRIKLCPVWCVCFCLFVSLANLLCYLYYMKIKIKTDMTTKHYFYLERTDFRFIKSVYIYMVLFHVAAFDSLFVPILSIIINRQTAFHFVSFSVFCYVLLSNIQYNTSIHTLNRISLSHLLSLFPSPLPLQQQQQQVN